MQCSCSRRILLVPLVASMFIVILYTGTKRAAYNQFQKEYKHSPEIVEKQRPHFTKALASVAINNTVVISIVDLAFAEMAINVFLTCFKPHKVDNHLIVSIHPDLCSKLNPYGINCYFYQSFKDGDKASTFDTKAFIAKMNVRIDVILDVLACGYSLLHTDVDMICFQNPVDTLNCPKATCDMATMVDGSNSHAAGYDFVHPSSASTYIYKTMKDLAAKSPSLNDQILMNKAIGIAEIGVPNLKLVRMPTDQVLNGLEYYETPKRYFAGDSNIRCDKCVVVQNNWIVSLEAKVYRAKELHHWLYDGNEYYSSKTRRYLIYANPLVNASKETEVHALKCALMIGRVLDRVVIVPKFHCGQDLCPLNSKLRLDRFDKAFNGAYREHTFLTHPLVPDRVKEAIHGPVIVFNRFVQQNMPDVFRNKTIQKFTPNGIQSDSGMTEREVMSTFGEIPDSVLQFHSMYNAFSFFDDRGFKSGGYRQYL